jgi:ribosomal protein L7Ae-like RNA K-turn-binding protein
MSIMPDLDNRLPGRGAYTCIDKRCLVKAVESRKFKHAFKCDVSVMAAEDLVEHVRKQLFGRIIALVGLANKAGMIISGGSMVSDAIKSNSKPGLVVVATDVSEAIGCKIKHSAEAYHVQYRTAVTKDGFGDILGKAPRSAIAVKSGGFVVQLMKVIDRYINFLGEV